MHFKISKSVASMNSTSDEELFVLMKNEDKDPDLSKNAWAEFYRRYSGYLWNCCLMACKSMPEGEELASDIFQSTMIKIYKNAGKFDPAKNSGIKSWIGKIAQNEFIDHIKKYNTKFSPIDESFNEFEDVEYNDENENELAEKLTLLKKEKLQKLLSILNEKEFKVLMTYMTYFQIDNPNAHLPDKETKKLCFELGVKSDTLRQIKKRALDKLKKAVINF